MLNLSDKELDRFSKEAAQEYEPGDVLGDRSWERLAVHLDRDLGPANPNPLRHIRRFPFYYAPAVLVLLGVSYYFIRHGARDSGSPPGSHAKAPAAVVQNPSSPQSSVYSDKSTPASSTAHPADTAAYAAGTTMTGSAEGNANSAGAASGAAANANSAAAADNHAGYTSSIPRKNHTGSSAGNNTNAAVSANLSSGRRNMGHIASGKNVPEYANASPSSEAENQARETGAPGTAAQQHNAAQQDNAVHQHTTARQPTVSRPRELTKTELLGLQSTKKAPVIDDSALRAFTLKSTAPQLIRNRGLHINRSLAFGVVAAPDFASVHSLAGDKPGSTLGVTVDYQFANRWYIGTGLLLDRKNYAARGQDFHAPPDYFQRNGIRDNVELIKGSFEMLEIPLNLRYDFSVSGSTLFFATTGLSSYLFASENNNYYYHSPFTFREMCTPLSNPNTGSYLFSSLNLSVGVETGLSNSLSLLVAPYMKIPVRRIGIGQVQMNTVGIDFSLRWSPVISRRRY